MRVLAFVTMLFISFNLCAYPLVKIELSPSGVTKVYDGDTFTIQLPDLPDVFGKNLSVRLKYIDTPEMNSSCPTEEQRLKEEALAARVRGVLYETLTNGKLITLSDLGRDKYFRLLAEVTVDGVSLTDKLITLGLAEPYGRGIKANWCNL